MLNIVTAGVAPGLALLIYFYLKDQYNTEPISVVLKAFIYGALIVMPVMFLQYVFDAEGILIANWADAFLAKGLIEELLKWGIFLLLIYGHVEFDEPYDGIVYGVAISLGFATFENILYLFTNGVEYAWGRAIFPVSSHGLFGVIMGFYFGKAKFSKEKRLKYMAVALIIPFLLHGLFNYILMMEVNWYVYLIPFMFFLWGLGLWKVKKARILTEKAFKQSYESL
ncbi:PrsW family intramembrane metalloprotease [Pradoshia eiseniae]|uniref:Protease PrsW n=1 Tax=Pradoshia eiseniae TaxID=2064768 RepID=A0A2S7N490_9BACI|nr:glutamic-type intramembrane protease PrsW [Pradoshia eiseniae]PQD96892.1 PrsW family intramembrane metalloprotease [Pradoshia eiseniae]